MNHQQLQREVLSCIWSRDLKKYLEASGHVFTEMELLGIAYRFAPTYEERLRLLRLLADHSTSVAEYARRCIAWQQKCLALFCRAGACELYELRIKDAPDAYEERYLCAAYDTALEMIGAFYKEYECEATEASRYTIAKRKILQAGGAFQEDELGLCVLGPGKTLISVDLWTDETENGPCGHSCCDCGNTCIECLDIYFPAFLPDRSAVRYHQPDGSVHYGVSLFGDGGLSDTCYIIPLDSEMLVKRNYDAQWGYHWHEHIPCPYVESVEAESLPADLRENYFAFLQYWENRL